MFEYICGKLSVKKIDYVALDINGLAYKIYISLKTFEKMSNIESTEKLYIHTNVKEDNISLYGFKTQNERELFKALISVNGVGPKLAIAILSTFNTKEIVDIILENEPKIFIKVPGLGIKKAQKIILDLKDKVKKLEFSEIINENSNTLNGNNISSSEILLMKEDLKLALESLGYADTDVSKWIKNDELIKIKNISEAIKIILKRIQK
ncbi:Holliday junction branch migration protein RuvA [Leptotrichia buccalis]|uniref:Holliday junction branch migration complex subunit RuvA n=1 Tax=Leptotrichia buccalis (strain ATCC 14201 / DSM 1135 / JCM 12969 / NCTC 10249 / C-1013-b) TaxID=523794 RepID=C7NC64_LEPBD|nr:Holliday junction branch migration protein RuvA [Leptotrichia buccalis]ACV39745.1 Holliday junction DNA helicase RuvA [Leptotrichia buccalis C-1013-b]